MHWKAVSSPLDHKGNPSFTLKQSAFLVIYITVPHDYYFLFKSLVHAPSADEWIRKLWYIYTMEYYSAIKKNSFESVLMRWMKLEPIKQSEVSQKDKDHYNILTHIYGILKDGNDNPIYKTEKETEMYRTDFGALWEKARV